MSTAQDIEKSDYKLIQYWHNVCDTSADLAKRIFSKESNINYQLSASNTPVTPDLELKGCTVLHLAARFDKKEDVEWLISREADPMSKNRIGFTPLHWAVKRNFECPGDDLEIRSCWALLLSAQVISGNSENPKDNINGLTHFHIACMANHVQAVEFFLKSGILVDETINTMSSFSGYTPLHLAARYSALEVIKVLLSYGANTELKDAQGMTFLCMLLKTRAHVTRSSYRKSSSDTYIKDANLKSMTYLLQNENYMIDYAGLNHFHLACSLEDLSIAERMLQNITDINQALDMDAPKWSGYTALHFAAYSSLEMVKMLVKNGANILVKNAKGVTPLDMCLKKYGLEDIHAILSLDTNWRSILMSDRKTRLLDLIFAMKDRNQCDNFLEPRLQVLNTSIPLDSPAWQGFTPLHIAIMFCEYCKSLNYNDEEKYEKYKLIMKLMDRGANVNAQDIFGWSPIHLAFRMQLVSPTYVMLNFFERIENSIDEDNLSYLHIACQMMDLKFVEKILQNTVDVNIPFKGKSKVRDIKAGMTPLHCAATNDKIVKILLLHGADPMLKDSNGLTAIHHSRGRSNAILSIPNLTDCIVEKSGLSHLHIAVRCENVAAVEKLLEKGANINQALLYSDVLINSGESLNNYEGDTPLDLALDHLSDIMIKLLLRRGADIRFSELALPDLASLELSDILKPIVSSLDLEDTLFKRLEREVGITSLHMACSKKDIGLIKALLASGADVNAQINVKSRVWPGFTPLHIVMDDNDHKQNLDDIVKLLLENGASLTLTTCDIQKTALYLACDSIPKKLPSNRYSCMRMILRAHKDFTINHTREDGLSYFHVAASIGDIISVKQFLDHGVDVTQRTHFFKTKSRTETSYCRNSKGCTALHLAVASSEHAFVNPATQLEMVDLLLNHGADVHAEDVNGNTPLHFMTEWNHNCKNIILRLIRSGLDVNSKNVDDKTFLQLLVESKNILEVNDVKFLLKVGCTFHTFDSVTKEGLIAKTMLLIDTKDLVSFIKSLMINFPYLMQADEMGRTVIHNIVSRPDEHLDGTRQEPVVSEIQYAMLMTELEKFDCHVDHQDKLGKTALHYAVLFRNVRAISGLLMAGADVNILDASGKTAFSYLLEPCMKCSNDLLMQEQEKHDQYNHFDIFFIFVIHVKKLLTFGLDVIHTNVIHLFESFEKFNDKDMALPKNFKVQINDIKSLKIAQSRFTFENFLSETDAIVTYLTLPQIERDAVDKFFMYDVYDMFTKYSQFVGILLMQYRKAVERIELNELAKFALESLSNFSIPILCSTKILNFLTNSELSNMLDATI